ncbi:tetraacyldisaccharide 4'-kinase [Nitrospira moscoviensis]|uniref:Tetraacyldisaccharide 4'-kinase n=1 Tax=Nitrospira moscoviensis TaxID=42253 RepID=A0A0K2GG44_NITMO|nr:tetraacyldisaccharide 4'-kinase [Nitrospira moscoviensis]ALA59920.1 Tetraacyldisaccharide 4'-kinase [Nitrospira moscoviensis]
MSFLEPGRPARAWLRGPAALYGAAAQLRNWGYDRGWFTAARLPVPVISVGNMTVGGTGKTPVVILLVEWLEAEGRRVAVLSRGYRRSRADERVLVSDGTRLLAGPPEAGDEPVLIARRCPRAVVAVGSDRAALGRWVLDRFSVDCVVLDDGFQHRALHRDLDIVLVDAMDAGGLEAMVPAGRLREPLKGVTRADALVITRADDKQEVQTVRRRLASIHRSEAQPIEAVFRPHCTVSVLADEVRALDTWRGKRAWLVSGIGNSASFNRSVTALGLVVCGAGTFRDHYRYGKHDIERMKAEAKRAGADLVLTTEKDAGKLAPLLVAGDNWWALRIATVVTQGEARLRDLVSRGVEG